MNKKAISSKKKYVEDANSYNSLCKASLERCDFCDLLFKNRFSMLKHNLTHIIIPLAKQITYQCDTCLHHFTSTEDLDSHIRTKHSLVNDYQEKLPEILQSIIEKQVFVKCDDELKELVKCGLKQNGLDTTKPIESCIKRELSDPMHDEVLNPDISLSLKDEPILDDTSLNRHEDKLVLEDTSLSRLGDEPVVNDTSLNRLKNEPLLVETSLEQLKDEPLIVDNNLEQFKDEPLSATDEDKDPICHRILFEEDIDDDLFKDLSADCQVSLATLYEEIKPNVDILQTFEGINFEASSEDVVLNKIQEDTNDLLRFGKAIHYDVLLEKELCFCRLCGRDFPNRYSLLKHEPTHIKMKVKRFRSPPLCCICERYIAGNYHNLRRHMKQHHPEQYEKEINYSVDKCIKCQMTYHNYAKHLRLQHKIYKCSKCDVEFQAERVLCLHDCIAKVKKDSVENVTTNSNVHSSGSVMKLCEMCFSFMNIYIQNRQNYEFIGEQSELGVRQICDKCNNKFFVVKLVRRKVVVKECFKPRVKHMTNQERLKKMQSRLKMIKKLNKY